MHIIEKQEIALQLPVEDVDLESLQVRKYVADLSFLATRICLLFVFHEWLCRTRPAKLRKSSSKNNENHPPHAPHTFLELLPFETA